MWKNVDIKMIGQNGKKKNYVGKVKLINKIFVVQTLEDAKSVGYN